jgi:alkylation response protein AidB-like acyl-CoA dehydrogenase
LQAELLAPSTAVTTDTGALGAERVAVGGFRKAALMVLGLAMQTYEKKFGDQQEVLMHLADMLIDVFASDSAVLRARAEAESPRGTLHVTAAQVFVNDAAMRLDASARQALAIMLEGEALTTTLAVLRRLLKVTPINTAALRRTLADEAVARGSYLF